MKKLNLSPMVMFIAGILVGGGILLSLYLKEKKDNSEYYYIQSATPSIEYECREGKVNSKVLPPNSKYAIQVTANNQYDRIRFTMRVTKDGEYVLVHDSTINGIARNKNGTEIDEDIFVSSHTLEELNQYDYGILFDSSLAGMKIPMLEEALYYANAYNLGVTLEMYDFIPSDEQVDELVLMISKYNQVKNLLLVNSIGFDKDIYLKFKNASPFISFFVGASYQNIMEMQEDIDELRTDHNEIYWCIHPWPKIPTDEEIKYASNHGMLLFYTNVFGFDDFKEVGVNKGIHRIQCQDIPMVKDTVREWVNMMVSKENWQ